MKLSRGARRAATILATTLLVSAASTAAASASTTVGPADITPVGTPITTSGTIFNKLYRAGASGDLTGWSANFNCSSTPCGNARLVVLRETGNSSVFDVVNKGAWEVPSGAGVRTFSTLQSIQGGDWIAVETDGPAVRYTDGAGGDAILGQAGPLGDDTQLNAGSTPGYVALFNATLDPKAPTETTVTAAPNPVALGSTVHYAVQVTETQLGSCGGCGATPGGTVSLTSDGDAIAGCQSVTVTDGAAACDAVSPPRLSHTIQATYSGDSDFSGSTGTTNLRVVAPTVVTPVANPNPSARRAAITYTASISPSPYLVNSIGPQSYSLGTAAFSVDGTPVAGCGSVAVSQSAVATCVSTAPPTSGTHSLDVSYSGSTFNAAATGHAGFEVLAPALSVPAAEFGNVTVGSAGAKTVTVTNDDAQAVSPGRATAAGSGFAIVADGCTDAELAPGASCAVQLAFNPTAAGASAGTLSFTDSAGASHSAALTGTGVAAPGPVSTPVPPKGGVFAPGAKTTLTVTTTTPSGGGTPTATVAVPLSCPANETCDLNGTVTIETSTLSKAARAAAASTTTVARFSKVHIAAGKVKTIKLHLSRAFIKRAQKAGIRRIHATLTINTVLGSGRTITTHQRVTVLLPKAAKKKAAVRPHFTG